MDMKKLMERKKLMVAGAIAAATLALGGGTAYAAQQGSTVPQQGTPPVQAQQAPAENAAADTDNVQQGDQTSPDAPGQADESKGPDTDNVQQGGGDQVQDGQPDAPGTAETAD